MINYTKLYKMISKYKNKKQFEKNFTWIYNHEQVIKLIDDLLSTGKMPTITYISKTLGLTRKTVYEHLKAIPLMNENKELTSIRRNMLLEKLYQATNIYNNLNYQAIALYLKYTDNKNDNSCIVINNFTINQTVINNLDISKKQKLLELLTEIG